MACLTREGEDEGFTMLKVFYAQPVDNVDKKVLSKKVEELRKVLVGLDVEVVAPYIQKPSSVEEQDLCNWCRH